VLSGAIPLLLLASLFIVICCDPELRDAEPVATNKRDGADERVRGFLLYAALAAFA